MNTLFEAAKEICDFMAERRWLYCVIGGLAVQRWGEPRTTLDVDISLLAEWGAEDVYVTAILNRFQSRITDGHEFAITRRVLLIKAANGRDIDIVLGGLPFEEEMARRAGLVEFAPGLSLPCCTAEDLFVMKAFANRPRDWLDAESVVNRQTNLDWRYILRQLAALCELKEAPEILIRAGELLKERP